MAKQDFTGKIIDNALSDFGLVARLFGITDPACATISAIVGSISQRRRDKSVQRLEKFLRLLERRVSNLENANINISEMRPDLLDEIIAKAVSDEDEDKIEYYAALIDYYISRPLEPCEIRLLSSAIKSLTIPEIKTLLNFATGGNVIGELQNDMIIIFWTRIHFLGLYKGSATAAKHVTQLSELGKKFVEICILEKNKI